MDLTTNFELEEFDCHDGTPVPEIYVPNIEKLCCLVLQPLRDIWGGALVPKSGYRTAKHNTAVGGAKSSTHLTAEGVDIAPLKPSRVPELIALIEMLIAHQKLPALGGFGKYPGWVHLDIRKAKDGHLRRWVGEGFGSEQ